MGMEIILGEVKFCKRCLKMVRGRRGEREAAMASCHAIQSLSNFTFRIWTSSAAAPRHLARQRRLPSRFGGEFGARLREFKRGHSASRWVGRAAVNGVNGSLILSRSGGVAECLMDVFSLRALSPFSSLLLSRQRLKQKL